MEDITKTFRNIFFVETRCSTEKTLEGYVHNKGFVLSARQSCAIESTALTNPDRDIYVFHSCPLDDDFLHHSPHFVDQLFSYPNVHLVKLNNTQLFNGSPVQQLYEKKLLESSSYPVEHSSDVIRFTLLWKFGGTYFDLDIVTLRSLKRLRSNWVGAESEWVIGTGVMNFKHVGSAHGMLQRILHHINYHYDKDGWASNGPLLLTSFIIRECKVLQVEDAANRCFTDFTVYRRHVLYPIRTSQLHLLFNSTLGLQTVRMVKTVSYSVHVWNKKSRNLSVDVGSAQGYALLADQFCPRVYRNCGTRF
ncbi:lactosylceramide 4-alpha-galactosyltransferase-like [Homalodisca vitripennis]|uniref:lactosylceramide 4-alpha-galactosyltransferase-like n=1 Tax=Homalodisca vitripennis TaxID=197043 RepID=UPI001EEBF2EE|nr:lactosylceramide 4-alpha-galactosyltransferase-like [Homalodisca vitripennis]